MKTPFLRTALGAVVAGTFACQPTDLTEDLTKLDSPIVNGVNDNGDPAVVYLDIGGGACTGTLVSPRIVLTAAHCLEAPQGGIDVFFGFSPSGVGTWVDTVGHQAHPSADIGMITLAQAGPATPIPMGDVDLGGSIGGTVRLSGFGVVNEQGFGGGIKRMGDATLNSLQGGIMFTSGAGGLSWTCYGDSGGPNFMMQGGEERVVGVTSFGTQECGSGLDGAVRTDTYIDWLRAYVDANEDLNPPTVAIDSPGDGATVQPGFTVAVTATDDKGILSVSLYIDDQFTVADQSAPYELAAPPATMLGAHTLRVVAKDRGGNEAEATAAITIGAACGSDAECGPLEMCIGGACLGDVGAECGVHGDCAGGQCAIGPDGARACTSDCDGNDACPDGFACISASAGAPEKCWPSADGGGGGCAVGASRRGEGAAGLLSLVLASLALLALRRRRG